MRTVVAVVLLVWVAAACAERNILQRNYIGRAVGGNQPYWFLSGQRSRSNAVHAVQIPVTVADYLDDSEDDDDQDERLPLLNDDEDDENSFNDDSDEGNLVNDDFEDEPDYSNNLVGIVPFTGGSSLSRNYWRSVPVGKGRNGGTFLVPNGIIELGGRTAIDEETGETALLLPRETLAKIPDGGVVAVVEDAETGKANKIYVRRRRRGPRRGNRRRGNRRRGGRRPSRVRVIRIPTRGGIRRRRPING